MLISHICCSGIIFVISFLAETRRNYIVSAFWDLKLILHDLGYANKLLIFFCSLPLKNK